MARINVLMSADLTCSSKGIILICIIFLCACVTLLTLACRCSVLRTHERCIRSQRELTRLFRPLLTDQIGSLPLVHHGPIDSDGVWCCRDCKTWLDIKLYCHQSSKSIIWQGPLTSEATE
jgi:hypothetical protein